MGQLLKHTCVRVGGHGKKKPRGEARRMASEAETKKTTTISVDKTEKTDRQTDGEGRRPAKQKYHKNSHTANMVLVGMQNVNNTLLCYLPINGDDDQGAIIGFHVHFRHRRVIAAHPHTHTLKSSAVFRFLLGITSDDILVLLSIVSRQTAVWLSQRDH
jgi:hypothetical protein